MMDCPQRRLFIAIVKQAVKDFYHGCHTKDREEIRIKKNVKKWVMNEEGTFHLCCVAWRQDPRILKEQLLNTFKRLENGKELRRT